MACIMKCGHETGRGRIYITVRTDKNGEDMSCIRENVRKEDKHF